MLPLRVFVLRLILMSLLTGSVVAAADTDTDKAFRLAREAYQKNDLASLKDQLATLDGHVLSPYVHYWRMRMGIQNTTAEEIQDFLASNEGTLVAQRMLAGWLRELARRERWQEFHDESLRLADWDTELTCFSLRARTALGDNEAVQEGRDIWLSGKAQPESCLPVFDALLEQGLLQSDAVWARIRLALESGNARVAKAILKYLPRNERPDPRTIDSISRKPQKYLQKTKLPLSGRANTELAIYALYRAARSWPDLAARKLDGFDSKLSEADRNHAWGQVAKAAAWQHHPEALDWFKRVAHKDLNDQQLDWRVRAALRRADWQDIIGSIEAMSPEGLSKSSWRYWKARALDATGKQYEANALLASLSNEFSFYGQLASEELGTTISSVPRTYRADAREAAIIGTTPGLQRALALYRANMRYEGALEWAWTVKDFDDKQLLAASTLAEQNEWFERSIYTARRTTVLHDFELRFPAPHRDIMREYTTELELDEAWVYGLIRQESRFVVSARSSAGAGGLMQLMPSTAKWIAKRLRLKNYSHKQLNTVDTNISMGTYYLRQVMDSLGNHPVVASAGYNAGPSRAARWRDVKPLPGEIYTETIPFPETRNYVKNVMSNTMYYARIFRQTSLSLKSRLGMVPGKPDSSN